MKCYYEILEVEKNVDSEDIKKAYRKLALQWHPDKNPDRVEECTKQFSLIQEAYEVLSDPNERAWYDRHRQKILRTGLDEEDLDIGFDLFPFFSSLCYSGFQDNDEGFYAVYRRVFEAVATEESVYSCEIKYPTFGNSKSDYEEVVSIFYDFWSCFSTQRPFSWLNKYDIRQSINRFMLKMMEKENNKLRAEGKRKRNEEIRALVAYIRKRDKRVAEYSIILEQKKVEQFKKALENKEQAIKNHLSRMGEYKESEENRQNHLNTLREIEESLATEFGEKNFLQDDLNDEDSNSYCVVCEKAFKSSRAFSNHLKSKRHKEATEELRNHLQEEDMMFLDEMIVEEETDNNAESFPQTRKSKSSRRKARKKKENLAKKYVDEDEKISDTDVDSTMMEERKNNEDNEIVGGTSFIGEKDAKPLATGKTKSKQKNITVEETKTSDNIGPKAGICDKCGEVFDSRTKLFKHLQDTNHATLKAYNNTPQRRKKNK